MKRVFSNTKTFFVVVTNYDNKFCLGDVLFEVIPGRDSTLKLVWIKLPLVESMIRSLNPSSPKYPHVNWSQRLNEMVSGDLIYPL